MLHGQRVEVGLHLRVAPHHARDADVVIDFARLDELGALFGDLAHKAVKAIAVAKLSLAVCGTCGADHALDARVEASGSRGDATTKARPIEPDRLRVDLIESLQVRHRVARILDLCLGDEPLARLAAALAKEAVVEGERDVTRLAKTLGVHGEPDLLDDGEAVAKNHRAALLARLQIIRDAEDARHGHALAIKGDLLLQSRDLAANRDIERREHDRSA